MSELALFGGSKVVNHPLPSWPVHDDEEANALMRVLESGKWWLYTYGGGPSWTASSSASQKATHDDVQFGRRKSSIPPRDAQITQPRRRKRKPRRDKD